MGTRTTRTTPRAPRLSEPSRRRPQGVGTPNETRSQAGCPRPSVCAPRALPPVAPQRDALAGRSTIAHAASGRTSVHPGRPRGGRPLQPRPVDTGRRNDGHDGGPADRPRRPRPSSVIRGTTVRPARTRFDCSGLVIYAFRQAGDSSVIRSTYLRSARSIYLYFKARGKASRSNPRIGDLVIWGGGTHIGIYIGGGKAISTLTNGVRIHGILPSPRASRPTSTPACGSAWPADPPPARATESISGVWPRSSIDGRGLRLFSWRRRPRRGSAGSRPRRSRCRPPWSASRRPRRASRPGRPTSSHPASTSRRAGPRRSPPGSGRRRRSRRGRRRSLEPDQDLVEHDLVEDPDAGPAASRSAIRRACAQSRSIRSIRPDRPSERSAAGPRSRARRDDSGTQLLYVARSPPSVSM